MRKVFYLLSPMLLILTATTAFGADSMITIHGYVQDKTCAVDTGNRDLTVDLMSNADKQYFAQGVSTLAVPFQIILSPCGASASAVRVGFSGVEDSINHGLLKIDSGASAATGLGIQILNSQHTALPLNSALSSTQWISLQPGQTNTLLYYFRLVATTFPVLAGRVSSTASFTLEFQ